MEQRGEDIQHDQPAPPSLPSHHVSLCLLVSLTLLCLLFFYTPGIFIIIFFGGGGGSHHSVLILLQPGAPSSAWQGRTLLRGANQLRQNLK